MSESMLTDIYWKYASKTGKVIVIYSNRETKEFDTREDAIKSFSINNPLNPDNRLILHLLHINDNYYHYFKYHYAIIIDPNVCTVGV